MTSLNAWLGFIHLLGAAVWLGAWVAMCVVAAQALRRPTTDGVTRHFDAMTMLGPRVMGPATLAVLGAGVWLVIRSPRAEVTDTWIVLGLVGYVLATVIGIAGLAPASRAAQQAMEAADLDGAVAATRRWYRIALVLTVVLVLTTADMAFRP